MTIELFTRSGNLQMADTDGNGRSAQIISQILALLDGTVKSGFAGSDRLAALAYRSGQYPMAASLLKTPATAAWRGGCAPKWRCVTVM